MLKLWYLVSLIALSGAIVGAGAYRDNVFAMIVGGVFYLLFGVLLGMHFKSQCKPTANS